MIEIFSFHLVMTLYALPNWATVSFKIGEIGSCQVRSRNYKLVYISNLIIIEYLRSAASRIRHQESHRRSVWPTKIGSQPACHQTEWMQMQAYGNNGTFLPNILCVSR